ncbi:MAG: hypothetical protein ACR2MO_02665 [Acidimicrobiales bacterium]
MTRRDAIVLRAFAGWTVYVWVTRMWNIVRDDEHGTAFKAVHMVLAVISVAFAVAAWSIVSRNRKRNPDRDRVDIDS